MDNFFVVKEFLDLSRFIRENPCCELSIVRKVDDFGEVTYFVTVIRKD